MYQLLVSVSHIYQRQALTTNVLSFDSLQSANIAYSKLIEIGKSILEYNVIKLY